MLRRLASIFTYFMRHYLPDAYLFAILLTFFSAILALIFTPAGLLKMIVAWGDGIYGIVAFAMQMILILVTGHCLALSSPVKLVLEWIAGKGDSPIKAGMIVSFVAALASWLSWGFGLIVGGLLALEVAKRLRKVDFPYLIAAAYSGFVVWHQGLSGSIPLVVATAKHPQNFIEQVSGSAVPVAKTIFASYNMLAAVLLLIAVPILYALIHPKADEVHEIGEAKLKEISDETVYVQRPDNPTLAERIDHSYAINMIFGLMGVAYLVNHFITKGLDLNLNVVIFLFFILGVLFHGKPVNYIKAVNTAIRGAGGIALQFPLYGGIQGIMIGTGLGKVIATWFVAISTPVTYYMLQFWAAGVINFFVPSGGGQWLVQGPITVDAASTMGIDITKAAMMVAWGDQWTNMIQPFWALPLLGLAGLSARAVMGYTTMTLLVVGVILSAIALFMGMGIL